MFRVWFSPMAEGNGRLMSVCLAVIVNFMLWSLSIARGIYFLLPYVANMIYKSKISQQIIINGWWNQLFSCLAYSLTFTYVIVYCVYCKNTISLSPTVVCYICLENLAWKHFNWNLIFVNDAEIIINVSTYSFNICLISLISVWNDFFFQFIPRITSCIILFFFMIMCKKMKYFICD